MAENTGRISLRDRRKGREEREKLLNEMIANRNTGVAIGDSVSADTYHNRFNYNTYRQDYFSGIQCKVFFGDIWVDDIVTIQYNISQAKEPIYGYASQTFDAVAMGTILGQGSLTISFKETGYLNVIKALLQHQKHNTNIAKENISRRITNREERNIATGAGVNSSAYSAIINPNLTPSLIRQNQTIEQALDELKIARNETGDSKSMRLRGSTGRSYNLFDKNRDFEDIAELLEDSIWGDNNGNLIGEGLPEILRADEFDYKYHDYMSVGIKSAIGNNYANVFNILLTFGDMNDNRAEHTLVALNDVHFTGQGMIVAPNGEPIGETYSFFFRDLNKSITQSSVIINPIKFSVGDDNEIDLSKRKDIEELLNNIEKNNNATFISIRFISRFSDNKWSDLNDPTYYSVDGIFDIRNRHNITGDLNQFIENGISDLFINNNIPQLINQPNNRPEKLAISVKFIYGKGDSLENINHKSENFIIEQQGVGTSSVYKVVSPTKSDYHNLNLIRREDFFLSAKDQDKKAASELESEVKDPITSQELETESKKLNDESFDKGEVFTYDEELWNKTSHIRPILLLDDQEDSIEKQIMDTAYSEFGKLNNDITRSDRERIQKQIEEEFDIQLNRRDIRRLQTSFEDISDFDKQIAELEKELEELESSSEKEQLAQSSSQTDSTSEEIERRRTALGILRLTRELEETTSVNESLEIAKQILYSYDELNPLSQFFANIGARRKFGINISNEEQKNQLDNIIKLGTIFNDTSNIKSKEDLKNLISSSKQFFDLYGRLDEGSKLKEILQTNAKRLDIDLTNQTNVDSLSKLLESTEYIIDDYLSIITGKQAHSLEVFLYNTINFTDTIGDLDDGIRTKIEEFSNNIFKVNISDKDEITNITKNALRLIQPDTDEEIMLSDYVSFINKLSNDTTGLGVVANKLLKTQYGLDENIIGTLLKEYDVLNQEELTLHELNKTLQTTISEFDNLDDEVKNLLLLPIQREFGIDITDENFIKTSQKLNQFLNNTNNTTYGKVELAKNLFEFYGTLDEDSVEQELVTKSVMGTFNLDITNEDTKATFNKLLDNFDQSFGDGVNLRLSTAQELVADIRTLPPGLRDEFIRPIAEALNINITDNVLARTEQILQFINRVSYGFDPTLNDAFINNIQGLRQIEESRLPGTSVIRESIDRIIRGRRTLTTPSVVPDKIDHTVPDQTFNNSKSYELGGAGLINEDINSGSLRDAGIRQVNSTNSWYSSGTDNDFSVVPQAEEDTHYDNYVNYLALLEPYKDSFRIIDPEQTIKSQETVIPPNLTKFEDIIFDIADAFVIDPSVIKGVIATESSGNEQAIGPETRFGQAIGLMQVLPSTAREEGLRHGIFEETITDEQIIEALKDPYINVFLGTSALIEGPFGMRYYGLSSNINYARSNYNLDNPMLLGIVAYNAGASNVRSNRGLPPFQETEEYLIKVLSYANQYARQNNNY